nr:EAL domain-containing protein [Candidatus Sulfurimonas ponti]
KAKINLLLLDIDSFSNINDSYGIEYGDLVFTKVEDILRNFGFESIDIYKLESDEYALVSKTVFDTHNFTEMANEISSFFNESEIELDEEYKLKISFSMGIASGRGLGVLNQARLAIKDLRQYTRGTYKIYDMKSSYIKAMYENVYWVNKIQESIVEDRIIAFFQPIINNKTKKIEKYESLARIDDDGSFVSPYHFMDAAKSTRLLSFITKSMIKQACKTFRGTEYEFSINITNDDLQLGYLEEYLVRNAALYNINPNRIVLELLEDISSLDVGSTLKQLDSLREKGFKFAIDDFGSESSNFSRLLEFQPHYLKIDGAFIKNILKDEKSRIITSGIVSIAHAIGIKVIAEYIHHQDVQDIIEELNIDYSQGYIHGEPSRKIHELYSGL